VTFSWSGNSISFCNVPSSPFINLIDFFQLSKVPVTYASSVSDAGLPKTLAAGPVPAVDITPTGAVPFKDVFYVRHLAQSLCEECDDCRGVMIVKMMKERIWLGEQPKLILKASFPLGRGRGVRANQGREIPGD